MDTSLEVDHNMAYIVVILKKRGLSGLHLTEDSVAGKGQGLSRAKYPRK
jgi:hypothetical protein